MTRFILLFDGVCSMCNHVVHFVADRDSAKQLRAHARGLPHAALSPAPLTSAVLRFEFASLQSPYGKAMVDHYDMPRDLSTVVLYDKAELRWRARAAAAARLTAALTEAAFL